MAMMCVWLFALLAAILALCVTNVMYWCVAINSITAVVGWGLQLFKLCYCNWHLYMCWISVVCDCVVCICACVMWIVVVCVVVSVVICFVVVVDACVVIIISIIVIALVLCVVLVVDIVLCALPMLVMQFEVCMCWQVLSFVCLWLMYWVLGYIHMSIRCVGVVVVCCRFTIFYMSYMLLNVSDCMVYHIRYIASIWACVMIARMHVCKSMWIVVCIMLLSFTIKLLSLTYVWSVLLLVILHNKRIARTITTSNNMN